MLEDVDFIFRIMNLLCWRFCWMRTSLRSHLQFQDACAQQLLQIDADIEGVQSVVEKALRGELTSDLVAADSHRVLSAGHVAVFDEGRAASDDSPAVGDVLLF